MPMDIYQTGALAGVVRAIQPRRTFLLENFFRNVIEPTAEEILFDVQIQRRRISPFVAPHVPARPVAQSGYRTDRFKPAMVKDLRVMDINRPIARSIGEAIGGDPITPAEREAAILALETEDQINMLHRRLEVMAADALLDGVVTVTGEGYPATTVDFGRPAGNTVALTSTARWGVASSTARPVREVQAHRRTFLQASGIAATDIVFTAGAWQEFNADAEFKDAVNINLRGMEAMTSLPNFDEGGELVGMLNDKTRLWLCTEFYVDPADDTEKAVLPDGAVLLGNFQDPEASQTRGFAVIPDADAGYPAEMYHTKSWTEKNPGQRQLLTQSCPLTILSRPAATFCLRAF